MSDTEQSLPTGQSPLPVTMHRCPRCNGEGGDQQEDRRHSMSDVRWPRTRGGWSQVQAVTDGRMAVLERYDADDVSLMVTEMAASAVRSANWTTGEAIDPAEMVVSA